MNNLYADARVRMLTNSFNWAALQIRMLAYTDAAYVFDETHLVLSQVGLPACESQIMTEPAASPLGYAQSNAAWFSSPPLGTWLFLILVDETGGLGLGSRRLIAYYDTGVNMPRVSNGSDQLVVPDWLSEQGWFRP